MKRTFTFLFIGLLAASLALTLLLSTRLARAAGFIVNSTGDAADATPGNGICETATDSQ